MSEDIASSFEENTTSEWLDGFRKAYTLAYPAAYEEGFAAGHNVGYDEAVHLFRVLLENHYDPELKEAFEQLIGLG